MNHIDEIKAKLSIEELVSGYVQLKKAGRNLKGLCPFHNDSRPSFMVSPEKGIAYCFSCNTGGDIFKFIQLIEKVDFPESVRILAERTGVRLPDFKPEVQDQRRRVLKANELAVEFFATQLNAFEAGVNYFKNRGLSDDTIKHFKLGFAPDSYHQLKDNLKKQQFSEKELLTAGLINQRSVADQNTYDRFRGRLIFPIFDHQGNAVGFGGRIMGEGEPKYLNSPDTPVYNKSFVLYGLNLAKESIKKEDMVVFVEGYMDVITAHQAGTKHVVATSGTALTAGQLKLIKRYTKNIALAFDQDTAGMEATKRAIELAKATELNVKIIIIPNGKDPDECIKASKEEWLNAVKNGVSVMDFYFDHALKLNDKNTLEGKKAIVNFLLPIIKIFPSKMEQNEHLKHLAFELKTEIEYLWEDMKRMKSPTHNDTFKKDIEAPKPQEKTSFSREEFLLGFILRAPEFYPIVCQNLIDNIAFDPQTEIVYKTLKNLYDSRSEDWLTPPKKDLPETWHEKLDILPLLIDEHYPEINDEIAKKEIKSLIHMINKKNLKIAQKDCEFRIREAQNSEERNKLLSQYNKILQLEQKI